MEHKETGCEAPEGPILCINNCGFFGSAATMNLCSKCHKELILKQQQADLAASSIDSILNGGSSSSGKDPVVLDVVTADILVEPKNAILQPADSICSNDAGEPKVKVATPNRCNTCKKRVGLVGFSCRCGNYFCAAHRYSDKHACPFDYQKAGRDAIAKANPVVKAEKLDKI